MDSGQRTLTHSKAPGSSAAAGRGSEGRRGREEQRESTSLDLRQALLELEEVQKDRANICCRVLSRLCQWRKDIGKAEKLGGGSQK